MRRGLVRHELVSGCRLLRMAPCFGAAGRGPKCMPINGSIPCSNRTSRSTTMRSMSGRLCVSARRLQLQVFAPLVVRSAGFSTSPREAKLRYRQRQTTDVQATPVPASPDGVLSFWFGQGVDFGSDVSSVTASELTPVMNDVEYLEEKVGDRITVRDGHTCTRPWLLIDTCTRPWLLSGCSGSSAVTLASIWRRRSARS